MSTTSSTSASTSAPSVAGDPVPDVIDARFFDDADATLRWLHATAPVYYYDPRPRYPTPMWILSKWEDVRGGQKNAQLFSRVGGPMLQSPTPTLSDDRPRDPRFEVATRMPNFMDPPEHTRHRQLVRDHFRPKRMLGMEDVVRRTVRECFDAADPHAVTDFVTLIADRIPLLAITDLLGIEREREEDFVRWSDAIFAGYEPGSGGDYDALVEMLDYFEHVVAARREIPGDDLITDLVRAEYKGDRLSNDEVLLWCWIYLVAGQETTANLLAGGVRALLDFPDERAKLIADPSLTANAVDEMLRWVTPTRYKMATVTTDMEIRGIPVAAGDRVYMSLLAANRDPEVFASPYRFDVTRADARHHVSFNHGGHYCLGAPLALMESRIVFDELLRRFPRFDWGGTFVAEPSTVSNRAGTLPIVLEP